MPVTIASHGPFLSNLEPSTSTLSRVYDYHKYRATVNKSDYMGRETVGEWIDRTMDSLSTMLEMLKDRFLGMPVEKLLTVLSMVAVLVVLVLGMGALEIFLTEKRKHKSSKQNPNIDDR